MKAQTLRNVSNYLSVGKGVTCQTPWILGKTAARTSDLTITDLFLLFQFRYSLESALLKNRNYLLREKQHSLDVQILRWDTFKNRSAAVHIRKRNRQGKFTVSTYKSYVPVKRKNTTVRSVFRFLVSSRIVVMIWTTAVPLFVAVHNCWYIRVLL